MQTHTAFVIGCTTLPLLYIIYTTRGPVVFITWLHHVTSHNEKSIHFSIHSCIHPKNKLKRWHRRRPHISSVFSSCTTPPLTVAHVFVITRPALCNSHPFYLLRLRPTPLPNSRTHNRPAINLHLNHTSRRINCPCLPITLSYCHTSILSSFHKTYIILLPSHHPFSFTSSSYL